MSIQLISMPQREQKINSCRFKSLRQGNAKPIDPMSETGHLWSNIGCGLQDGSKIYIYISNIYIHICIRCSTGKRHNNCSIHIRHKKYQTSYSKFLKYLQKEARSLHKVKITSGFSALMQL